MSALAARGRALREVVRLAPPSWPRFALGIALTALTLLCAVGLLTVSGALISKAALRPPVLALGTLIVGVRFFGLSRACLRYAERLVTHDVAFRALATLRERFFARLAPLVPGDLGVRQGDLLARFVQDVDALQHLHLRAAGPPLAALVASTAAVAVAWVMLPAASLVLAAGLAVAGVLLPAATAWLGRVAARRQASARAALATEVLEVVQGAPELVVAGRGADRRARLAAADRRLRALAGRDAVAAAMATGAGSLLQGATAVAVAVVAVPAVEGGRLDGVLLAALTFLALASFEAVAPLPAAAQQLDACAASAQRLLDVTDRAPAVRDPAAPRPLPAGGTLEVHGADVALGGRPVLRGATLALQPRRAVALLGPSGGGKTTLASLLVRFRDPDAGRVTLGGVDVRDLAQDDVRRTVCLVAQDARLFTTTIAENVRLARPEASDAEVRRALEDAGLGPWLDELPDGLATLVGEDGAQVSGGQRQRIALARGLLSGARFLVLDEPTAHLDPEGAETLLRELPRLAAGRGVLAVVHDRRGLEAFDEVLELREGRVVPGDLSAVPA
ncbi:thiol reductant ABC exporter subunit CydC [Conexibacter sp. SYSU D00693]|uniref:thiol reductant ABC exporter subunit CydC n=1 Tax=Conexibacter sp. SYSU D00693 TaxID=2812560 RepID=UPI00196B7E5D|nr:thiol reductant ABC exporter subunit CydC [Conexibacter sp. SYSU D00693]